MNKNVPNQLLALPVTLYNLEMKIVHFTSEGK